jgi:hypothetical protein
VGLVNMTNLKYLDLTFSQVQSNVGLTNMSDPRHLDLAVSQVQDNVGLTNMSDPSALNVACLSDPCLNDYLTQKSYS